ncbi:MAG: hypothetical protein ACI4SV_03040 [Duodenibacillus sp.]
MTSLRAAAAPLAAAVFVLLAVPARAFTPDMAALEDPRLMQRFPPGSIVTRERADQAMREVGQAKKKMHELADYSRRRCQENFFVNSCIEDVRQAKMRQDRRFLAIESEARAVIRRDEARLETERQAKRDLKAAQPPKRTELKPPAERVKKAAAQKQSQVLQQKRVERTEQVQKRQAEQIERQKAAQEQRAKAEQRLQEREAKRAERERKIAERQKKNAERKAREKKRAARKQ